MKLIFDIETVRQYEHFGDAPEDVRKAWEYVSNSKWPERFPGETYMEQAGFYPEFGRVIVISAMDSVNKEIVSFTGQEFKGANAEQTLLKTFKDRIDRGDWRTATPVGHYIKGFDIPYLVTRMAAHNIAIPAMFKFYGRKPWEVNVLDSWEVWRGGLYRTCQSASLPSVCLALGIESPKDDISGGDVAAVYFSGEEDAIDRIRLYCEADVKATAKVVNKMFELKMV